MDEHSKTKPLAPDSQNKNDQARRPLRRRLRLFAKRFIPAVLAVWAALAMLADGRSNPRGTHITGPWHQAPAHTVSFVTDLTWTGPDGTTLREQNVFDALFRLIDQAETFLVLDFFLINDFAGDPRSAPRAVSGELIEALAQAKARRPDLEVLLITDPINRVYGSESHPGFERLESLGVEVVETNLDRLRDSNPIYSSVYRLLFRWFGNKQGGGFLPNPFLSDDATTLRSWLRLLNFKANHRKVAVAGRKTKPPLGFVTSANPHDASSGHSNVALLFEGNAALDLVESEVNVARFSGLKHDGALAARVAEAHDRVAASSTTSTAAATTSATTIAVSAPKTEPPLNLRIVTEAAIRDAVLSSLDLATEGDTVDLAMFYIGHRDIVNGLLQAAQRGARVRLILDPNRDAFGRTKNGIPNRSVAHELVTRSMGAARVAPAQPIAVRWYKTQGEQFHSKLTFITLRDSCCGKPASRLLLGSANFTRRNLDDFNLETNIEVHMQQGAQLEEQVRSYLDRLWNNGPEGDFTLDYSAFADPSRWSTAKYRWMEKTGLSTF